MAYRVHIGVFLLTFAVVPVLGLSTAGAQEAMPVAPSQVESNLKGTIGLGLIGAELGLALPALAGLDETWSLIVFPTLGAAGGAVAGYFLLDEPNHVEASVAALVAGMALLMPSIVITLSATQYDPDDHMDVTARPSESGSSAGPPPPEEPAASEPAEGAQPAAPSGEGASLRQRRRLASAGSGLLRLAGGNAGLSLPGFSIRPAYSMDELRQFGGVQRSELHVSVMSGAF